LIAKLEAAFLFSELGISPEPRIDHARYVESWLRVLKDDKRATFTAAAKENQAAVRLTILELRSESSMHVTRTTRH
jgi:antirestriction protein ArdC